MDTPEHGYSAAAAARATVSRRRALAFVGALTGVLGVGWLADALAGLPARGQHAGSGALEAGAFQVALTLTPAAPVAGSQTL
ncbi:MAG TPA: hypothetical protein VGR57_05800, partial [Ktedonobacterales bacterium]|nr:hypothetical protein [Ktedonobacterales bacterium]